MTRRELLRVLGIGAAGVAFEGLGFFESEAYAATLESVRKRAQAKINERAGEVPAAFQKAVKRGMLSKFKEVAKTTGMPVKRQLAIGFIETNMTPELGLAQIEPSTLKDVLRDMPEDKRRTLFKYRDVYSISDYRTDPFSSMFIVNQRIDLSFASIAKSVWAEGTQEPALLSRDKLFWTIHNLGPDNAKDMVLRAREPVGKVISPKYLASRGLDYKTPAGLAIEQMSYFFEGFCDLFEAELVGPRNLFGKKQGPQSKAQPKAAPKRNAPPRRTAFMNLFLKNTG